MSGRLPLQPEAGLLRRTGVDGAASRQLRKRGQGRFQIPVLRKAPGDSRLYQIAQDRIKALVYNLQTSTAVTTNLKSLAAARHIPTVGISETIDPTGLTFQDWQLKQLKSLDAALQSSA